MEESSLADSDGRPVNGVASLDVASADWLPSVDVTTGFTEVADEEEFMIAPPSAIRLARTL